MTRLSCPRCRKQFEEDEDDEDLLACDVCGAELVREGGPVAPVAGFGYADLVRLMTARTRTEALVVKAILGAADIPVTTPRHHFLEGGPVTDAFALLVPREFLARAIAVCRDRGIFETTPAGEVLAKLWARAVVPAIEAWRPDAEAVPALGRELALVAEPVRRGLFEALGRLGPRGLGVVAELLLAFARLGPREAARESAAYLSSSDVFRPARAELLARVGELVASLRPRDTETALRACAAAERFRGVAEAERALVPLLDHEDASVRDAAIEALFSISGGETLGYEPDAEPEARRAALARWQARVGGRTA